MLSSRKLQSAIDMICSSCIQSGCQLSTECFVGEFSAFECIIGKATHHQRATKGKRASTSRAEDSKYGKELIPGLAFYFLATLHQFSIKTLDSMKILVAV